LIITDQTMPNITGAVLTRQCRNIRPDVPVILCTGFSEALSPEEARFLGVNQYLMKPVVKSQLARAIRLALGKPDPEAPLAGEGSHRKESPS
jgi:CheY-like chemotaxis protein